MADILVQKEIFEAEKKANEIYDNVLGTKIDTSNYTDCRVENDEEKQEELENLQFQLLKIIDKYGVPFYNVLKQHCSSVKILKDKSIKNRLELLSNIVNNKRLKYLREKDCLNKNESDKNSVLLSIR